MASTGGRIREQPGERPAGRRPYVLVLGSHKGGTGRTTCALALAYLWGQAGFDVALIDADPVGAARAVALLPGDVCAWKRVTFYSRLTDSGRGLTDHNLILIDSPALTERSAQRVLRLADGVVLTCRPDPLSLRTIPVAARALEQARRHNPRLNLLGIAVGIYNDRDNLQVRMLQELRQTYGDLLLEPPVPRQQAIGDWPIVPGRPLPAGPARDAYVSLASALEPALGNVAVV